jgi:hypothetical protein
MGLMPAAAVLFRMGHVRTAKTLRVLAPGAEDVYRRERSPASLPALRTLVEQSRVALALPDAPELTWDGTPVPAGTEVIRDLDRDFLEPSADAVVSDTGELRRSWTPPLLTIDTPRSQAASGALGGRRVALSRVAMTVRTAEATVSVTSLDGLPIADSACLLVSAVARARVGPRGELESEPVEGRLEIVSDRKGLVLLPLAADGRSLARLPLESSPGGVVVDLATSGPTHWYLVTSGADQGGSSPRGCTTVTEQRGPAPEG